MQKLRSFKFDKYAWLSFLLGGGLFFVIFGASTLDVTYDSWIFNGYIGIDILQHYTGWVAFRWSEWTFPLTFTPMLSFPFGGAASLTDCIPLFAVLGRIFSPILPATFQYFGWFSLLCMALGGYSGAKLLGVFSFSPMQRVLGSMFFSASPILLERVFQHTALAAHFLVVLALYTYFKERKGHVIKAVWKFSLLAVLATSIHVYFVPMVLAIAFAYCVDIAINQKKIILIFSVAPPVLLAVLTAFVLGFFSKADYVPGGYGQFGMNLNAFWNPTSWNWATWDASYQHLDWSVVLPQLPVVGDSVGSFVYLGLGVLLGLGLAGVYLCALLLATLQKNGTKKTISSLLMFAKQYIGLGFSCFCLLIFSISNVVTANSRTLLTIPLPDIIIRFCDMFRSSGRLVWPIYYLLFVLAMWGSIAVGKWLVGMIGKKLITAFVPSVMLCLLLLVQGFDMSEVLMQKHVYFDAPIVPSSYTAPENWDKVASQGRVLYQLEMNEDRTLAMRAALSGMPTNFYLLARGSQNDLALDMMSTREELLQGNVPFENTAFITKDTSYAQLLMDTQGHLFSVFTLNDYTVFLPV